MTEHGWVSTSDYSPVDINQPTTSTTCKATVHFRQDMGEPEEEQKVFHHRCCLFEEYHKGLKHFTPSLLLTCGGERVTHDIDGNDITKTWSPYNNEQI